MFKVAARQHSPQNNWLTAQHSNWDWSCGLRSQEVIMMGRSDNSDMGSNPHLDLAEAQNIPHQNCFNQRRVQWETFAEFCVGLKGFFKNTLLKVKNLQLKYKKIRRIERWKCTKQTAEKPKQESNLLEAFGFLSGVCWQWHFQNVSLTILHQYLADQITSL